MYGQLNRLLHVQRTQYEPACSEYVCQVCKLCVYRIYQSETSNIIWWTMHQTYHVFILLFSHHSVTRINQLFIIIFAHFPAFADICGKTSYSKHFHTNLGIISIFGIKMSPRLKSDSTSRSGEWDARTTFNPSSLYSKFIIFEK